jgi:DNA-binding IscR family transcriptional regulator
LHQGRAPAELGGRASELAALSAMLLIGRDHAAGAPPWTANRLATALGVSGTMLGRLLASLQRAGLIAAAGDEALVPARDLSAVRVIDVIEAVRAGASADDTHAAAAAGAARAMAEVDAAIRATLGSRLIVDLYDEAPKQPGAR